MTPASALDYTIVRGGHPSLVSSRRYRRYQGQPGEVIERMPPDVRAALTELRSADVAAERVPREAAWLASDEEFDRGLLAYRGTGSSRLGRRNHGPSAHARE